MPEAPQFSVTANFLSTTAAPSKVALALMRLNLFGLTELIFREVWKRQGYLAVGGTLQLTPTHLLFAANGFNRRLNDDSSLSINVSDIIAATWQRKFISDQVTVSTTSDAYRFRCFSGERRCEEIRSAACLTSVAAKAAPQLAD